MSTEIRRTTYLRFDLIPTPERKTKVVLVHSIRQGYEPLGVIRWFGRWRQYVFEPEPGAVFNPDCMDAINAVIRSLMAERRQAVEIR